MLIEAIGVESTEPVLGSFSFDRNGDISESPITILQVGRGDDSGTAGEFEGGAVVRVMRPSASLVAPAG